MIAYIQGELESESGDAGNAEEAQHENAVN
jgi:hypothetical protein